MARRTSPAARKWRAHLTREEAATIARADAVKEDWRRLKHQRALIVARASARARRADAEQPQPEA